MDEIEEIPDARPTDGGVPAGQAFAASPGAVAPCAEDPIQDSGNAAPGVSGDNKLAGDKKPDPGERESLIETVKTVVYALLIALVIRTFLFQPFNIPSASMEATLLVGDYLFVEKFAYGYSRYSFPWGLGPIPSGRVWDGQGPHRGDVVVFKLPIDNSTDYIKRVIGLPGDRIQVIDGQLYLDAKPVPRVRVADYVEKDPLGAPHDVEQFRETLPGGKSYLVLSREPSQQDNNTGVYVVPPGHYFMMGDNRDNSLDSRFAATGKGDFFDRPDGVGYVPAANLVGKAEFIFFSNDGPLWEIWTWPWTVRFHRIFTIID